VRRAQHVAAEIQDDVVTLAVARDALRELGFAA